MKTYTVEDLMDALHRHGLEYCEIKDGNDYILVKFDKSKEVTRTVIFDTEDLIAIGQAEKLLNSIHGDGRFGILNHIRLLTDDVFDHEKQEWR